jgi:hypothetical protein
LGANLLGADLSGANLSRADLSGIKNYSENHSVFQVIIKNMDSKVFTESEWSIIGMIVVHKICWDSIKERYGKKAMKVFKKLSKEGVDEFEKKYAEVLKNGG